MRGLRAAGAGLPRGLGRGVAALAAAVVVVIASSVAVVALADQADERTASDVLADARKFLDRAPSARFTLRARIEVASDEDRGIEGSTSVDRSEGDGVVAFPDRFHVTEASIDGFTETLAVGGRLFIRFAETERRLAREKWAELEKPEDDDRRRGIVRPRPGPAGEEPGALGAADLPRLARAAEDPEVVRTAADATTIRARFEPGNAFDDIGVDLDSGSLELTVVTGGRVVRAVVSARGDQGSLRFEYQLRDWGTPVEVSVPDPGDIDPTPGIDEEDIAEYDDTPVLTPGGLPEGWILEAAYLIPADETVEDCEQVSIDYTDPDDPDAGYLWLYELPVSCADLDAPARSDPFVGGAASGWILGDEEDGWEAQVLVGSTVIQVETDLSPEVLAAVFATLGPADLVNPPRPLEGVGPRRSA